jgi:hypothetical protein
MARGETLSLGRGDRTRHHDPYPRIPGKEIMAARDGLSPALMVLANLRLGEAAEQAAGITVREPQFHEDGWRIALTTPKGIVGLWSCWLGNQFYLGYPKAAQFILDALGKSAVRHLATFYYVNNRDRFLECYEGPKDYNDAYLLLLELGIQQLEDLVIDVGLIAGIEWPNVEAVEVPDDLIQDILGVEPAKPVKNLIFGTRQWARFRGPQLPENQGRVWVDHSGVDSNIHHFKVVTPSGELREVSYGHHYSRGIRTFASSFFSGEEPEAPNASPDVIQPYRDKFLALACAVAQRMGGAQNATIDYGFCMVPEDLKREGYKRVKWLKGVPGRREGWGAEVVRAIRGEETVVLKSGNSLVPWSTIRRVPFDGDLEDLKGLLTF